jgi:hypothetical protein
LTYKIIKSRHYQLLITTHIFICRIAGWRHKEHPLLYNVLHIGDLVLSIAGIPLNGANSVRDILKTYTFPRVSK